MNPTFIALVMLDALLLWLLITLPVRGLWFAKAAAIVIVLGFNFVLWSAQNSGRGWPVRSELPRNAAFVQCVVQEPDELTHTAGAIYVWVIPLDNKHGVLSFRPSGLEPRAYREPYSRDLHQACESARKKSKTSGGPVAVRRSRRSKVNGYHQGPYRVYKLPTPRPPTKGRA